MDRQVIERAQRGDEAAFAALALASGDRLHAIAHHILRDRDLAADATQAALVEIWRHLPQLRDPESFEAWTHRIVLRAAFAEHRRRAAWQVASPHLAAANPDQDGHSRVDDRDELDRLFAQLPIEHRAVVVLKHYARLTDHEIAIALDIPDGTVRSRLYYAMRQLRAARNADRRTPVVTQP